MKKFILSTLIFLSVCFAAMSQTYSSYQSDRVNFHRLNRATNKSDIVKTMATNSTITLGRDGVIIDENPNLAFSFSGKPTERTDDNGKTWMIQIPATRNVDNQDFIISFVRIQKSSEEAWIIFTFDGGGLSYRIVKQ